MHRYNLFRRTNAADLYYAMPVDISVRSFITDKTWDYAQSRERDSLSGFAAAAAESSAHP